MTRRVNSFSKKLLNHMHALALYHVWYNFCRRHTTTRVTSAMASGLAREWRDAKWLVRMIDDHTPKPKKPGPKVGTKYRPRLKG